MPNRGMLRDQIGLVTGAGGGIGKAIALALAAEGAAVWLVGRAREKLDAVARASERLGAQTRSYPADLTCDRDVRELAAALQREIGHIDILIHCAAEIRLGTVESAPVEDFDRQYRLNVRAPFLLTQVLLPLLRPRSGQIVFVNSSAGLSAAANASQYAATKHALRAIADSLRQEVNVHGIRVLSVYPGRTATPMQATVHSIERKDYHPDQLLQPEDVAAMIVNALTLSRSGEVTDIYVRPLRKP
jgi:NAD(P)-dependent dehydrogenase (short-subunit alcohol dehydrogenase family)